ncbi:MAG: putative MFS family arabinose efflux permease [Gammaproteobacteria bacterium]|jgi:predicted MFS family arabinose efflux permease
MAEAAPEHESFATRNIALLSVAAAITGSNQAIVIAVSALLSAHLAPLPGLATLPVTISIVALALTVRPATSLIYRIGRKGAFMVGAAMAMVAGVLAPIAVIQESFGLFCFAIVFIGISGAFGQQYRFAIADSVGEALRPKAISLVLLGGVAAGFLGPRLSFLTKDLFEGAQFAGSFIAWVVMGFVALGVLAATRLAPVPPKAVTAAAGGRSNGELLRNPLIIVPMVTAMLSYSLMILVMVAAPLTMVYEFGHSVEQATTAIQWHIVAMFLPSLITGDVIGRIGAPATIGIGLGLLLIAVATNLSGHTVTHFNVALMLLGMGWNFGFIGSTALLAGTYRPEEAARVQGLNEPFVFGAMAVASISSGLLLQGVGWLSINVLVIPLVGVGLVALVWRQTAQRKTTFACASQALSGDD